jgi:uncharacterized protein YqiB (DUF1249 family)
MKYHYSTWPVGFRLDNRRQDNDSTMDCTVKQFLHHGIPARDFAGLMELYECNYIRLRNLVPDLDVMPDQVISRIEDVLDLHLHVVERCKFTTTLNLTYHFHDEEGSFPAPDMRVRMYHDAQVGEVISCGRRRGVRHALYNRMFNNYTLTEKWHMNRFLQKWLGYCLMQGHRFIPGRVVLAEDTIAPSVEKPLLSVES